MDSLTTTGAGAARTMTSDSGDQQGREPPWGSAVRGDSGSLCLCVAPVHSRPAGHRAAELG